MPAEDVPPLLMKSVPPIFFTDEHDQPERAGTCVLMTILGCPVIATAAHVLRKVENQPIWLIPPDRRHLVPLGAWACATHCFSYCNDDRQWRLIVLSRVV